MSALAVDDSTLVARSRHGDGGAFEQLVRKYLRAATAVGISVLHNVTDAEDVAQDAFVVAFESLETCRDPSRFAAWLLTIVRNRARNRLSQSKSRAQDAAAQASAEETVPSNLERLVAKQQLLAGLSKLSELQREVVLLHDMESWTHAEIAETLGISEVNSRQHLFVARKAMRAILSEDNKETPETPETEQNDGAEHA